MAVVYVAVNIATANVTVARAFVLVEGNRS